MVVEHDVLEKKSLSSVLWLFECFSFEYLLSDEYRMKMWSKLRRRWMKRRRYGEMDDVFIYTQRSFARSQSLVHQPVSITDSQGKFMQAKILDPCKHSCRIYENNHRFLERFVVCCLLCPCSGMQSRTAALDSLDSQLGPRHRWGCWRIVCC